MGNKLKHVTNILLCGFHGVFSLCAFSLLQSSHQEARHTIASFYGKFVSFYTALLILHHFHSLRAKGQNLC